MKEKKNNNPPKTLYLKIYTDGGVFEEKNIITWAYIITDHKGIVQQETGTMNTGGEHWHNVELAESEAIHKACIFCKKYKNNYKLYTDSQSVLDKINGKVPNATKNERINGIKNILKEFKDSPYPCSLTIQYQKRCSDEWSTYVHKLTDI
jgi:ribonuclease HI